LYLAKQNLFTLISNIYLLFRACRLRKKAQHEANKLKLQGLNEEHSMSSCSFFPLNNQITIERIVYLAERQIVLKEFRISDSFMCIVN
jgi:hypothetical protein